MKRSVIAAMIATGALIVAPAIASAPIISVTGSAWISYPDFPSAGETTIEQTAISAHLLPNGSATGTIVLHSEFGDVRTRVTCVEVVGDTVYVGGFVVSGFEYLGGPASYVALGVQDRGQGQDEPDLVAAVLLRQPRPPGFSPCALLAAFPPVFEVVRGNYEVRAS